MNNNENNCDIITLTYKEKANIIRELTQMMYDKGTKVFLLSFTVVIGRIALFNFEKALNTNTPLVIWIIVMLILLIQIILLLFILMYAIDVSVNISIIVALQENQAIVMLPKFRISKIIDENNVIEDESPLMSQLDIEKIINGEIKTDIPIEMLPKFRLYQIECNPIKIFKKLKVNKLVQVENSTNN